MCIRDSYYRLYVNFGERVPIYKEALAGTDEEFYPPQANPGELVSLIAVSYTHLDVYKRQVLP